MLWEVGNADKDPVYAKTCYFNMSDCYEIKTMPVINEMSQNQTYLTGGSNLTVKGFGFDHGDLEAKIDGVECIITQKSAESFSCTIQPKATVSQSGTPMVGHNGLRVRVYDYNNGYDYNIADKKIIDEYVATTFEHNGDLWHKHPVHEGWFIPPKTTRYRFHLTCSLSCKLDMGKNPNDATSLQTIVELTDDLRTDWYRNS